jgi:hypothetical protein
MNKLNVDCLILIFHQMDRNPLYPCLLVNRGWCRLIVPILWKKYSWDEDLWYSKSDSRKKLFNTIISFIPSTSKKLLSENDIKLPSTNLLKPILFNYISFCEFPVVEIINVIVEMVFE